MQLLFNNNGRLSFNKYDEEDLKKEFAKLEMELRSKDFTILKNRRDQYFVKLREILIELTGIPGKERGWPIPVIDKVYTAKFKIYSDQGNKVGTTDIFVDAWDKITVSKYADGKVTFSLSKISTEVAFDENGNPIEASNLTDEYRTYTMRDLGFAGKQGANNEMGWMFLAILKRNRKINLSNYDVLKNNRHLNRLSYDEIEDLLQDMSMCLIKFFRMGDNDSPYKKVESVYEFKFHVEDEVMKKLKSN